MKKFWEQLKPQERRAVAGVGVILFLVLNYFLVWPRFKEWGANERRREKAQKDIQTYQAELRHKDEYTRKIRDFESEPVPLEDQDSHFENFIADRVVENGVVKENESPLHKSAYDFFLEKQVNLQLVAMEPNLVNFLYSLGAGGSMVRVRSLILHPADIGRNKLHADVAIVASYQKATPTPPARTTAVAAPETPAAKPPAAAVKPPAAAAKPTIATNKSGNPNIKRP